jgi:MFS family permease
VITGITAAAVVVLVPAVISVLAIFSPPPSPDFGETFESLKQRNGLISNIAQAVAFAGLVSPLVLFKQGINQVGWPALGLGFGLMVVLPVIWVCVITLPAGLQRFREFWRFTEIHQKCGLGASLVIYLPLSLVGFLSVVRLWNRWDQVASVIRSAW